MIQRNLCEEIVVCRGVKNDQESWDNVVSNGQRRIHTGLGGIFTEIF